MRRPLVILGLVAALGVVAPAATAHPPRTGPELADAMADLLTESLTATDTLGSRHVTCTYFEDGSGVCFYGDKWQPRKIVRGERGGDTIATFQENTFPWDCSEDGNGRCGQ